MKTVKRSLISIIRNPLQTILMFLIVFVLGNILFGSISISQSCDNVKMDLRSRSNSHLVIAKSRDGNEKKNTRNLELLVEELRNDPLVEKVNVNEIVTIYEGVEGHRHMMNMYNYSPLYSIDNSIYDYEIIDGRYYTQEDLDNLCDVIVLPKWLGYEVGDYYEIYLPDYEFVAPTDNRLSASDMFKFKFDNRTSYRLKVIGLYQERTIKSLYKYAITSDVGDIEIPHKCMDEIIKTHNNLLLSHSDIEREYFDKVATNFTDEMYSIDKQLNAIIITTKGLDANEATEKAIFANKHYPGPYYTLTSSAQEYRYVQAPLENLTALSNVALYSSAILIIVILSLVTNLFIKNRTKEIGVLMALGEKKAKIIMQFVLEIMMVGLLATSLAMVSGNYLGKTISKEFMKIQIDIENEEIYHANNPDQLSQIDLLEAYEVEIGLEYYATIYTVSALILLCSSVLPVFSIVKTDPKDVLM